MEKNNFTALSILVIAIAGTLGLIFSAQSEIKIFETSAKLAGIEDVRSGDEVTIIFSDPIITGLLENKIHISPQIKVSYRWDTNKKLAIIPDNYWKPEEEYKITIRGVRSIFLRVINTEINFKTAPYPKIEKFHPVSGEKNVIVGIEDPILATFDKPLNNFKVKFAISPYKEVVYQLDAQKTKVQILPADDLEKGKEYNIQVFVKYKKESDNDYRKIYETSFVTKEPDLTPDQWDKNFEIRLEQARKYTIPRIREGKYIDINLRVQILTTFENGRLLDAYLVSTGKRGMETKTGQFKVSNKSPRPWSKKYNLYMPYWMAMVSSGEFGIHELPEWPGGYKEGQNHLGTPVSHGCIRLGVGPAKIVYNWADLGTPVVIHY
jgi:lipoprotein-anchoring transpeptidase ErfK/SrfK